MRNLLKINIKKYFNLGQYFKKNTDYDKYNVRTELFKKFIDEKRNRFELGLRYPSSQESDNYYKWFNSAIPSIIKIIEKDEEVRLLQQDIIDAHQTKVKLNEIIKNNEKNNALSEYFKANKERHANNDDNISDNERLLLLKWVKLNVEPISDVLRKTNNLPIEYEYPLNKPNDEIRRIIARSNFVSKVQLEKQEKNTN